MATTVMSLMALVAGAPIAASSAPSLFRQPSIYRVGTDPGNIVVADFNGDGILDLATPNYDDFTVSVLLGRKHGRFNRAVTYPVGVEPIWMVSGDFNGDGHTDLITVSDPFSFLAGNGDGTFAPARDLEMTGSAAVAADFDGDGKLDLALADYSESGHVSILYGNGDGTFGREQRFDAGRLPFFIAAADLNGDGLPDIVVANSESSSLTVLLGTPDHSFIAAPDIQLNTGSCFTFAIGDMNQDGIPDLVVPTDEGPTYTPVIRPELHVLLGRGDGTFQLQNTYSINDMPFGIAMADFNGDGSLDVVVGSFNWKTMNVFTGNGDGTLTSVRPVHAGIYTRCVAIGDFDGDGTPDFVASASLFNPRSTLLVVPGKRRPAEPSHQPQ